MPFWKPAGLFLPVWMLEPTHTRYFVDNPTADKLRDVPTSSAAVTFLPRDSLVFELIMATCSESDLCMQISCISLVPLSYRYQVALEAHFQVCLCSPVLTTVWYSVFPWVLRVSPGFAMESWGWWRWLTTLLIVFLYWWLILLHRVTYDHFCSSL